MQSSARKPASPTRIADLRASVRTGNAKADDMLPKPPKPKKGVRRETEDERAAKAERQAMLQHTTSLLKGGNSGKPYLRPGERAEKKNGGLFLQLVFVMLLAAGVAYALDPSIVPAEWTDKAHAFIAKYIKL